MAAGAALVFAFMLVYYRVGGLVAIIVLLFNMFFLLAALALFKAGNYQGAIDGFQSFVGAHPSSQLVPRAYYWIGNSYFNLRDYKNAIANQQKLVNQYPSSPKVPDALLNIASCQQGLGDASEAKKTLKNIVSKYPLSNAAELAKKRLASTK